MSDETSEKRPRRTCPLGGPRLLAGFGDLLPTRGRGGPARVTCSACRGKARVASSTQVMGVLGFVVGLLVGAAIAAHLAAAQVEQSTLYVLGGAIAGGFLLSFVAGYAFLTFEPDGDPPAAQPREGPRR